MIINQVQKRVRTTKITNLLRSKNHISSVWYDSSDSEDDSESNIMPENMID